MKTVYHYEVTYLDDDHHKHLHFCKDLREVKFLKNRFNVQKVSTTKYVVDTTNEIY